MMILAWKRPRFRAKMRHVRVDDLKHNTFGGSLRAAGVSFEDRQDLFGRRSARSTTHYSAAELSRLIAAANTVCDHDATRVELVVLRGSIRRVTQNSRKRSGGASGTRISLATPTGCPDYRSRAKLSVSQEKNSKCNCLSR
jgi:uncharacterized caspase-like protein